MTPPDPKAFAASVTALKDRVDQIHSRTAALNGGSEQAAVVAMEELSQALEEISVAEEELAVQGEELAQAQGEAQRSEARYRELFDLAPDGYLVTDLNATIIEANRRAAELLGVGTGRLSGKPLAAFVAVGSVRRFRTLVNRLREGAATSQWEARLQPRAGEEFPSEIAVSIVHAPTGEVEGWRWLLRDVSRRKALEREAIEAGDRERQRIGRELHDDLGQRLSGAAMLLHGLQTDLEAEGSPHAERAGRVAAHLTGALRVTRSLAHALAATSVKPQQLAAALEELCEMTGAASGLDCRLEAAGSRTLKDAAFATHLFRIAQEAVTNAVRHGGARSVTLALCTDPTGSLTISDDGRGFDPEAVGEGGGMGLQSMRYRAHLIGATFDVRPRPSGGTVVECRFTL